MGVASFKHNAYSYSYKVAYIFIYCYRCTSSICLCMFPSNVFNNTIKHFVENICRWYEKQAHVYDRKTTFFNTIEEVRIIQFKVHVKRYLARHIIS